MFRAYGILKIVDRSIIRKTIDTIFEKAKTESTMFCDEFYYYRQKCITLNLERMIGKYYISRKTKEHVKIVSLPRPNITS